LAGKRKLKGKRAKGLSYERLVGKTLGRWKDEGSLDCKIHLGRWFYFIDKNGHGWCQPDIYLEFKDCIILIECKLTQTENAFLQMKELYVPVLQKVHGKPVYTVQVCKILRYAPKLRLNCIMEMVDRPRDGEYTWHFLGR